MSYNCVKCTKLAVFHHNNQGHIGNYCNKICSWQNDKPFMGYLSVLLKYKL